MSLHLSINQNSNHLNLEKQTVGFVKERSDAELQDAVRSNPDGKTGDGWWMGRVWGPARTCSMSSKLTTGHYDTRCLSRESKEGGSRMLAPLASLT